MEGTESEDSNRQNLPAYTNSACKGPVAGQNVMVHLRTERGLVGQDPNTERVDDSVACRIEPAGKQDGCARPFGSHRDLSQEQQEATKGLLLKMIMESNQNGHQDLIEDTICQSYVR